MSPRPKPQTRFGAAVRRDLDQFGWSLRELARRKAEVSGDSSPESVENERRQLNRWLNEGKPAARQSRRDVARAFGLDEDAYDDLEEEPSVATLRRSMLVTAARLGFKAPA